MIIGAAIQLVSGPGDFMWHSVFGVDGLMSPPHLALATGILINTIAPVVGLARILPLIQSKRNQALARAALVPAFERYGFSVSGTLFMFVLPLSNGEHFRFNPDPVAAIVIATIALPFVSAMIFLLSARTIGKLGHGKRSSRCDNHYECACKHCSSLPIFRSISSLAGC